MVKKKKNSYVTVMYLGVILCAVMVIISMTLAYVVSEITLLGKTTSDSVSGFKIISESSKDDNALKVYLIFSIVLSAFTIFAAGSGVVKFMKIKNLIWGFVIFVFGLGLLIFSILILTKIKDNSIDLSLVKVKVGFGAILQLIFSVLTCGLGAGLTILSVKK